MTRSLDLAQLYHVLAETTPDAIITIDEESTVLSVNPAAERMFGYTAAEIVGQPLDVLMPERMRPRHHRSINAYLATGERHIPWTGVRLPVLTRDGTEILMEVSFGEFTANGRRLFSGFLRDVTDKVAAEQALAAAVTQAERRAVEAESLNAQVHDFAVEIEATNEKLHAIAAELEARTEQAERTAAALAESETRYRLAAEVAQLGTWSWNLTSDEASFDARVRGLFAFPDDDPKARVEILATRVHPEDRERVRMALERAADPTGDGRYDAEYRVVRPDGSERFVMASGVMQFEGVGDERRPTQLVGTVMDVTVRKRAEEALTASERQLRTMIDAIPTLAWTARADGYIDWYNAQWYAYTGTTPDQMVGWGWQTVHDATVLPDVMARWQSSIATGHPFEMTFPLRGADGRFRPFLTRVMPLKDASGQVVRWFGTNTDVEAERAARAAADAAREAAEGANQAKTDFLASMSHELRTPLNAIAGYAELIELGVHGPVTEEQREAIRRIQRSQRHLLGLINDVLNFAKLEAGQVEYDLVAVRVDSALDLLESLVEPQLRAKALRFERVSCQPDLAVRADGDKLQQILVNLLSNAIKFTASGGSVTIACRERDGRVDIVVRDTGIGIPADQLEAIFAPFVQVDRRLNTPHEGVGLGLSISRDLARGMGGDLTVDSTVGAGSAFTLTLPGSGR